MLATNIKHNQAGQCPQQRSYAHGISFFRFPANGFAGRAHSSGAKVCGPPAIGRRFKTIGYLVVLNIATLDQRPFCMFFP
jgi:hypothetical protein